MKTILLILIPIMIIVIIGCTSKPDQPKEPAQPQYEPYVPVDDLKPLTKEEFEQFKRDLQRSIDEFPFKKNQEVWLLEDGKQTPAIVKTIWSGQDGKMVIVTLDGREVRHIVPEQLRARP